MAAQFASFACAVVFTAVTVILIAIVSDLCGHKAWRRLLQSSTWRFGLRGLIIGVSGFCVGLAIHLQDETRRTPIVVTIPFATVVAWAIAASIAAVIGAIWRIRTPDPLAAARRCDGNIDATVAAASASPNSDFATAGDAVQRKDKPVKWWLRRRARPFTSTSPYGLPKFHQPD